MPLIRLLKNGAFRDVDTIGTYVSMYFDYTGVYEHRNTYDRDSNGNRVKVFHFVAENTGELRPSTASRISWSDVEFFQVYVADQPINPQERELLRQRSIEQPPTIFTSNRLSQDHGPSVERSNGIVDPPPAQPIRRAMNAITSPKEPEPVLDPYPELSPTQARARNLELGESHDSTLDVSPDIGERFNGLELT